MGRLRILTPVTDCHRFIDCPVSQGFEIHLGMGQNPGTPGEPQNSW